MHRYVFDGIACCCWVFCAAYRFRLPVLFDISEPIKVSHLMLWNTAQVRVVFFFLPPSLAPLSFQLAACKSPSAQHPSQHHPAGAGTHHIASCRWSPGSWMSLMSPLAVPYVPPGCPLHPPCPFPERRDAAEPGCPTPAAEAKPSSLHEWPPHMHHRSAFPPALHPRPFCPGSHPARGVLRDRAGPLPPRAGREGVSQLLPDIGAAPGTAAAPLALSAPTSPAAPSRGGGRWGFISAKSANRSM